MHRPDSRCLRLLSSLFDFWSARARIRKRRPVAPEKSAERYHQTQLFGNNHVFVFVLRKHFQNHKQTIVECLKFGSLSGIEYVFHQKGVQVECLADILHYGKIMEPVHIYPGDCFCVFESAAISVSFGNSKFSFKKWRRKYRFVWVFILLYTVTW